MTKSIKAVRFSNGETYLHDGSLWAGSIERGDCEVLTGKAAAEALETYRRAELLKLINPGDTLTTVCTYYNSRSGTARYLVFIPATDKNGRVYIRNITHMVAELAGFQLKGDAISMGGYGYSKSFQIAYSLGCSLWPNGTPEPHGTRNGEPDSAGGYAINASSF